MGVRSIFTKRNEKNKIILKHITPLSIKPVQLLLALDPWHGPQALAKGLGTYPPHPTDPRHEVMWMRAPSTPCRLQSQHRGSCLLLSELFLRQHGVAREQTDVGKCKESGVDHAGGNRHLEKAQTLCWKSLGWTPLQTQDVDSTRCPVSRKHLWESLPSVLWQVEHFRKGIHVSCMKKKTQLLENQHVTWTWMTLPWSYLFL